MPVALTTLIEERPRQYEAADLDGTLRACPVRAALSDADLEHQAQAHYEQARHSLLECCDDLVELVRRAGPGRLARAQALARYRQLTGESTAKVQGMFATGRYWTPARRALYPTLSFSVLWETVRYTHREGDTLPEREARIARVAKEAADADLSPGKVRELAQSVDRSPAAESRGAFLELDDPGPTPPAAVASEPELAGRLLPPDEGVAAFVEGLLEFLTAQGWQTGPGLVRSVGDHLRQRMREARLAVLQRSKD